MNSELTPTNIAVSQLADILPQLAQMLAEAMQADRCAVFVYSDDLCSTVALFRHGYDDENRVQHRWTDSLSPVTVPSERYVIETKQPLVRSSRADFTTYPLVNPGQEIRENRLTDVTIPLIWNDHVQGSACIWRSNDPAAFTGPEVGHAIEIGQLMAMTIVFARGYQVELLQRQRLDTLLDVASVSTSGGGLNEVLQALSRSVRAATGADICSLFVFDEQSDEVLDAFQDGMRPDEDSVFQSTRNVSALDVPAEVRMRGTQKPVLVRDFDRELAPGSLLSKYLIDQHTSELLLLPIIWQSESVGVIYCWYREEVQRFSNTAIETAEAIAQQAGGVVSRARMEATLQRQTAESEALLRIGQAVLSLETLEPVLDEIARALEQLIPFHYASIGMLTADGQFIRILREWGDDFKPILGERIPVDASISGAAIREAKLISTKHIPDDPRAWQHVPRGIPLNTVMVAPLSYDSRIFGTLFIARPSRHQFTSREEQLLALLSQQAAVAIERVQSREEMSRRAERQALLARVGDLLVASENPEHSLQRIADLATGVIADGVVIGLAGWEYGSLRWIADSFIDSTRAEILHNGLSNIGMPPLRDRLEDALVSKSELSLSLTTLSPEYRFPKEFLEELDVSHLLVVPLYQQDRAPGLMIFLSREEESPFREAELQLGRIIAQRIGDALERQQTRRNHEGLLRVSEALHARADIDDLVRTISVELDEILPCDQMIIADVDRQRGMLRTRMYRKGGVEGAGREYFPIIEGICGEAVATRLPIMDNQADVRERSVYGSHGERIFYQQEGESALVAPLIVEDEIIGVVFVNRTGRFRFTSVEFETFLLFAGLASAALDRTTLEQHNRVLYRASTEVLAAVVDAKDPTTMEHSRHVAFYSRELATLMELPAEQIERIELAGLLHDIGKLGIPDRVLLKPGCLSEQEYALIKTHPDRGARILQWHPALGELIPMVRHHHESHDGRGYPAGLEGDEIPIGASIICIADAFDTITSERTYHRRRSVQEAMDELERCSGSQFRPELVRRFVAHLRADPALVQVNETVEL